MVASSKSVSSTVDTQSGAFMPVTVGPEGSGLMVVGSMQHYLVKDRHSMYIWIYLLKISAPNSHQDELVFGSFPEDKSLCVVHYLRHHKKRTCALRGSETKLFISWKAPHSGVSRDTLRRNGLRWVWRLLALICQGSLPIRRSQHRPAKQSRNCRWLLSWRLWVGGARVHSLLYTRSQNAKEMPFRMLYSPTTEVCAYWWFVYRVCKLVQMLQSLKSHVISHSSRNCGR